MKNLKRLTFALLTVIIGNTHAEDPFLPSNILMLDSKFSHHVMLVEKQTHKLHLYENDGSYPKLVKTYNSVTGKKKGDKAIGGDHKTPEGIYNIYDFYSKEELHRRHGTYADIYGSGAFPMNYPNFIDSRAGKTGGGIWLHSTDNDDRIAKGLDSRGCVVLQNADLRDISQYIEIDRTPIVVVQDVNFLSKTTWERNRKDILDTVQRWATAWQNKDFATYIDSYDSSRFHDSSKGSYNSYKTYKQAVFARPDKPTIKFSNFSILVNSEYAVVELQQDYQSAVINDMGKKTLFLKKDANYDWKIVGELWTKIGDSAAAFVPSKRFFKE